MSLFRSIFGVLCPVLLLISCAPVADEGSEEEDEGAAMSAPSSQSVEDAGGSGGREESAKEAAKPIIITVTAENWKFSPALIRVKKGQQVTVRLEGKSGVHGFAAPTLGINAPISPGQLVEVDLPTVAAGTHSFFCSIPCGAGHREMFGQIVIEE